jgi:NADH-quinone oxidoreductase subunit F
MQKSEEQKYLFICQSKSCLKRGSSHVRKELKQRLKEQKMHKKIRVVNTKCMDACKCGPNVVYGNKLYQEVGGKDIDSIIRACQ